MAYTDWVTQRTNVNLNPRMVTNLNGWAHGANFTKVASAGGAQIDATALINANGILTYQAVGILGGAVGTPVYGSMQITVPAGYPAINLVLDTQGYAGTGGASTAELTRSAILTINPGETKTITAPVFTTTAVSPAYRQILRASSVPNGARFFITNAISELGTTGPYFDGSKTDLELERYEWSGTADASASILQTRAVIPVIATKTLTVSDVLYGDRTTSYRWEVFEHANGVDNLIGTLDGVSEGKLTWTQNAAVKGGGNAQVLDLAKAQSGMLRIGELPLESLRVRPVLVIRGLPEVPLGIFLVSAAGEQWEATGRVWSLELLDKCTVPSQDLVDASYSVPAGALVLQTVKSILWTCGETITINESSTLATSNGMVWEAGTSKLKIINDLLDVVNYNALWMDGYGNFQATPRVLPADRPLTYDLLGVPRELRDGEQGIYDPSWTLDRDSFSVPNKVIAVEAAEGTDVAALIGSWTNEDPNSPYSYQSRGRWIPYVLDGVETPAGTDPERLAFLNKRAQTTLVQMSAVQAQIKLTHLPIPARVSEVLRFSNSRAGIDTRYVITRIELDTSPLGLMNSTIQEVISL